MRNLYLSFESNSVRYALHIPVFQTFFYHTMADSNRIPAEEQENPTTRRMPPVRHSSVITVQLHMTLFFFSVRTDSTANRQHNRYFITTQFFSVIHNSLIVSSHALSLLLKVFNDTSACTRQNVCRNST